ncbi:MAG: hypothetical protein HY359_08825 [Candidatus Rokubacteria bacterium]|nr:hypothetical protein [Candidatus Rokubacteria bacterium]
MLKNATYDLVEAATVLSKGLHRYETFRKDAKGCRACGEIWAYMKRTDEAQLARILSRLKAHFEAGGTSSCPTSASSPRCRTAG